MQNTPCYATEKLVRQAKPFSKNGAFELLFGNICVFLSENSSVLFSISFIYLIVSTVSDVSFSLKAFHLKDSKFIQFNKDDELMQQHVMYNIVRIPCKL